MYNLCYGMKYISISQLPGGSYSHPNGAIDLCGLNASVDVWRAVGHWKCVAGPWGSHTYFFTSCNEEGLYRQVRCADGRDRVITLALTHAEYKYVTPRVGKVYKDGEIMYEEGKYGQATGNHIHAEIAQGVQTTKHYDKDLGVYVMNNELNILKYMFVCRERSVVIDNHGAKLPECVSAEYIPGISVPRGTDMYIEIEAKNAALAIRKNLQFAFGKNTSPVVYTLKKGERAAVTHWTERFEKDGYEWAQVEIEVDREKLTGYVQLDTKNYLIKKRRE